jgi:glycosyltransferase involved in cell wall biosynthesis
MGKTRVLVVLTDLHGGGAQRIVLTLLTHLPRERFDLHLALVTRTGRMLPQVPPDVPVHDLGAKRVRGAALPLARLVRALRPDVVFSTLYHLNQMVLLLRPALPPGTRLVIREAITLSEALRRRGPGRLSSLLLRRLYPSADLIVCQCEFMADDLARHFAVPRAKMATIYNPIDVEHVRSLARAGTNPFRDRDRTRGPHLVALGRLDPQKGFDHLIRRLPMLLASRPEAHLWIVGEDGAPGRPTARALEALVRDLRLQPRVHFTGFRPNPYPYLAHADLFVLSSRYEGLPNALIEALALGCPVVALDRPGGTREILERSGLPHRLVPELDWRPEWFRGEGPDEPEPDLSAFSLERALEAYGEALGPLTPST